MITKDVRFWENRRKLANYTDFEVLEKDPEYSYFADADTREYELMQLVDAVEILITPANGLDDSEDKHFDFKWEAVAFTDDKLYIQLYFADY